MTISSIERPIEQPIEQRNTARGKPGAITHFDLELNTRQNRLLEQLPEYNSRTTVPKSEASMTDLSALTAKTGDEFAMFTRENERLLIRGNRKMVNISLEEASELSRQGYIWSGHTHPGTDFHCLTASHGDVEILKCFHQEQSVIYNSVGEYNIFGKE